MGNTSSMCLAIMQTTRADNLGDKQRRNRKNTQVSKPEEVEENCPWHMAFAA